MSLPYSALFADGGKKKYRVLAPSSYTHCIKKKKERDNRGCILFTSQANLSLQNTAGRKLPRHRSEIKASGLEPALGAEAGTATGCKRAAPNAKS